jgi:poly(3-hydroxybutyrate) depolymerase
VVVLAGGKPSADPAQLRSRLLELQPNDPLPIEIRRGNQPHKLKVTLGELPETIPPGPLPPAQEPAKAAQAKRPQVGSIRLKAADGAESAWAYVPENYDPQSPCGVVVWLGAPGEVKPEAVLALWKGPCDRDGLIVASPQSLGPVRWQIREARLVPALAGLIAEQYAVDGNRVVVCGRQTGGTVALAAGFRYARLVRGVAAVDAPVEGRIAETDPAHPLAIYMATAGKSRAAGLIRQSIAQLRQMRYPVTVKDLGPEPRDLNAEEVAELARWIDTLDRI